MDDMFHTSQNQFQDRLVPKILEFMNLRIKEFDTYFYKKCIEEIEIKKNKIELGIYFYEPLRLFLVNNFDDYFYYLSDHQINNNTIQRELNLTNRAKTNLLRQFNAIELNNIDALKSNISPNLNKIIFVVSPIELSDNAIIRIRSKDSLGLFLGDEILRIAEHQDMERLIGYMINKIQKKKISESVQMFREMYGMNKSLDQDVKDRILFFSGFCLHALGTTYTYDADMIYWAKNQNKSQIKKAGIIFSKHHKLEYFIHTEIRNDIEMTGDVLTDPRKHFYFMGMKIVGINIHLQRLYYRASAASFVDIYMLNKINKFNVKPCFPLMTLRDDPPIIFTQDVINDKLRIVKIYLRDWHGIKVSDNNIKKIIQRCKNYPFDPPFRKQFGFDGNVKFIEINHHVAILQLMGEYFDKHENVLIIDNIKEPHDYGSIIKKNDMNIIFVGSDEETIEQLKKEQLKKEKKYDNMIFVNKNISQEGTFAQKIGDESEESDILYEMNRLKNILIQQNSNQIFKNKKNFMDNMRFIGDDSTIIVTYLDGVLIENALNGSKMYQIKDNNDTLIFGIYEYDKIDDNESVVVFLKDSERYYGGLVEIIVALDDIKDIFVSINYEMIREGALYSVSNENKIDRVQKKISEFFKYVVFKKTIQ